MAGLIEQLHKNPVVAAVNGLDALDEALASDCTVMFVLASTILDVRGTVQRIRAAGKLAMVHLELVEGLASREVAVDALIELANPDGIISTKPALLRRAHQKGLATVQRVFALDSLSIATFLAQGASVKADVVEVLPGIMPRVIREISDALPVPVIAGGLIQKKEEVVDALRAGALAISTTNRAVWRS